MNRILLVGGGGHCASCIEVIESMPGWEIAGIVDVPSKLGSRLSGYEIIGTDEDLPRLAGGIGHALVTIGQLSDPRPRRRLFEELLAAGFALPSIVAGTARVSRRASIGQGTIVMHYGLVKAGASVGSNCILNSRALIEHDARVGDHCHISTGAIVNGGCLIGEACFVGSGAVIVNGASVAAGSVVGAGAIVVKDIVGPGTYVGCPARRVR